MAESDDPTVIRTIAVTAGDLVAALESRHRSPESDPVLRITPPFSGRMRARLHVPQESAVGEPTPIALEGESLVDDSCPAPPEPDEIEDALRADQTVTYTIDRHRERYETALQEWRETVPDHAVDSAELPGSGQTVTVSILGTVSGT